MGFCLEDIKIKMNDIKRNNKSVITNYYNNISNHMDIINIYLGENSVCFYVNDNSIIRGYFYSSDKVELKNLLSACVLNNVIIDVIMNNEDNKIIELLMSSGYEQYAVFKRMSNSNISNCSKINQDSSLPNLNKYGTPANLSDVNFIHLKLHEVFDPYTSHIMTCEELREMIQNNQVIIEISDNKLISFLIYKIEGRRFYINHVYNSGPKEIINCILTKALRNAINENRINYLYSWVDEKNERSIRFHNKYGMEFDGLKDYVFVKPF